MPEQPVPSRPSIHPATIWVPIIIMALGVVVLFNYIEKLKQDSISGRLPMISRVEKDLAVTERSGKEVHLSQLQGKVFAVSWVFTNCPRSCPGVVAEMNKAFQDIRNSAGDKADQLQFVSFSVDPEDKPKDLEAFTKRFNITTDHWWFVNGPKEIVRPFMTKYFGFWDVRDIPEKDRLTPGDKFEHDPRVVLVDGLGNVRGMYDLGSLDPEARKLYHDKFRADALKLLAENGSGEGTRSSFSLFVLLSVILGCCGFLVWLRVRQGHSAAPLPHAS